MNEIVKLPIFWFLVRARLIGPAVVVLFPVSVAVRRMFAMPFKSVVGSNVPNVPFVTGAVPLAKVV